jgi:multiple sugar transport system substrate-binding protein
VALPLSLTPHGFWFNKDLMKQAGLDPSKPPQTIAELNSDMAAIKAKLPKVYPFAMMTAKGEYAVVNMWPWLQAYCKTPPMTNTRLGWTQPRVEQAFGWFQMMAKKGWMPLGNDMKDNRQLFATDQVAFTIDGPYMRGIVANFNAKYAPNTAFADTFGAAKVPVGPSGVSRTAIDIHQITMSAHATNGERAAAWKFVHFMVSSPEDMRDFIIPEGELPPLIRLQKQFAAELDQPYQQAWVKDIIPEARPIPYNPQWYHASDYMVNALQKVVNGGSVKSALQDLEDALKRLHPQDQS